jgi:N-acetylglucosaminyldiphosphoundecaprenol N-acetyl-beta-D-mannosaminyltransferase
MRVIVPVLSAPIDVIGWDDALAKLSYWSARRESRYICICNVHSVVTATLDSKFCRVVKEADMSTADGAPVAWAMRRKGYENQQRINGPDLMWRYCELAQSRDESIFFYGSTEETLAALKQKLIEAFPTLQIAGVISPPFRTMSQDEDAADIEQINASGAGVVLVGLGCPKQELWMATHRGNIHAVMVGVGGAFDYHAGTIKRAPLWMQKSGLEWFYRLCSEPRRLWKRYLVTNSLFIWYWLKERLQAKFE